MYTLFSWAKCLQSDREWQARLEAEKVAWKRERERRERRERRESNVRLVNAQARIPLVRLSPHSHHLPRETDKD
jgi:hypothetical protein